VSSRILVAGLGNVLMGDDAIGPYCARQLMAAYEFPPNVEVADLGTPGPGFARHLSGADIVLIVDALRSGEPGTIAVYDLSGGSGGARGRRLEANAPGLEESLLIAHLAGDRPFTVRLVGLVGASFAHGIGLTDTVQGSIQSLIDCVLSELKALEVDWTPKPDAAAPPVWLE
jgi:hydrogenase maturation protease